MEQKFVVNDKLRKNFENAWRERQVIFFSAPCGFGKTTTAKFLLARRTVCYQDIAELNKPKLSLDFDCDAILLDNLQMLKDLELQNQLVAEIRKHKETHFVLLSRGVLPGWLMPFRNESLLQLFANSDLLFDQQTVAEMLHLYGVELTELELVALQKNACGYPLALNILCQQLKAGASYNSLLDADIRRELFRHLQTAVYNHFDFATRNLLLSLAPFASYDVEFARTVTGNSRAGELLGQLQQDTSMFLYDGLHVCRFWPFFKEYLMWQQELEFSAEEQKNLYRRAALYYELHGDYISALDCYVKCGEHNKVSELLLKNSELHPGLANFDEMEPYYRALPRETIMASPALMCGMSMLCAVCMDYENSEFWYQELQKYVNSLKDSDPEYKMVLGRLAYLDVGLPQRGVEGTVDIIKKVALLLTNCKISMPEFSVTSCLPSIMNGGKDFCQWSKTDDLLYKTMRLPIKIMLGRDGVGLPECAIAESKFEKGENISGRILDLLGRLDVIQRKGTPDIEFAIIGLLVRLRIEQGEANHAREHLAAIRERFVAQGKTRFLPNIDAMLCRVAMYEGDDVAVDAWYQEKCPRDLLKLRVMLRYQYLTRVMVEIVYGNYQEAMLIMAKLRPYFQTCRRVMDLIYLDLLTAICCYQMSAADWQTSLHAALALCQEYQFIQPVAQFGVAILPLLEQCSCSEKDFLARLTAAARRQAAQYPDFLRSRGRLVEPLSLAEQNVLRLLCHHKTNAEIGEILGIKLPTVKTHVSNVLRKLEVKSRGAVKDAAIKKHLI